MFMSLRHEERIRRLQQAGLYLVTSQEYSAGRSSVTIVRAAVEAGVRLIQLREKSLSKRELFTLGLTIRALTRDAGALLIVNDHVDVALALDADGVHLGQDDFPPDAARRIAPNLLIGVSTHSEEEAQSAQRAGASYVNIGPVFPTATKSATTAWLGVEGVRRIARGVTVPFTVMGGIRKDRIAELAGVGARIFAVISAVTAAPDPAAAARELLEEIRFAVR